MKYKILLDCDPGHDDAIAIMLASSFPIIDLKGISVVSGNQTLDKTAVNAYNVSRYLNNNVPICKGSDRPLKRSRLNCGEIHGESGLDGFIFPTYDFEYDSRDVEDFIYEIAKENKKIIMVTTGPMTNLAKALNKYPDLNRYIEKIIIMGGSTDKGNISPYAEFNILADAEAAKICFESNIPFRMIGLNVTRKVLVLPNIMERMAKINTPKADLFNKLMVFFNKTQKEVFNLDGGPLHDPVTMVSLIDESVLEYQMMDVEINISNTERYGESVCKINPKGKIEVATKIDVDKYWDIIEEALKN